MSDLAFSGDVDPAGCECELIDRYSRRLLEFAGRELPNQVRGRVDAEEISQSVYRSFFQRR